MNTKLSLLYVSAKGDEVWVYFKMSKKYRHKKQDSLTRVWLSVKDYPLLSPVTGRVITADVYGQKCNHVNESLRQKFPLLIRK